MMLLEVDYRRPLRMSVIQSTPAFPGNLASQEISQWLNGRGEAHQL